MLTLEQAWDKNPTIVSVEPEALAICTIACALNLTGARFVSNAAMESPTVRLSAVAKPFLEAVNFIQRDYHKHPDHVLVILGTGYAQSAVIKDRDNNIVFDPQEDRRVSVTGDFHLYRKADNRPHVYSPQALRALASISYIDAVKKLRELGLWVDHSWGYDQDNARGSNYL